jgi:hypothetical protein
VFNEKTPLDDDAKPQDSMSKGLTDKLNWMKVRAHPAGSLISTQAST